MCLLIALPFRLFIKIQEGPGTQLFEFGLFIVYRNPNNFVRVRFYTQTL